MHGLCSYSFRARKRRAERASAVVRLQALTRGALARRRSIELKLKLKRDKSARVIQWRFRRFSASHFTLVSRSLRVLVGLLCALINVLSRRVRQTESSRTRNLSGIPSLVSLICD